MRKLLFAICFSAAFTLLGTSSAFAGGSSDTSGEGFHCYLFFSDHVDEPDRFAQAMVNDDEQEEVIKKVMEFLEKYFEEGFTQVDDFGNLGPNFLEICLGLLQE